MKFTLEQLKLRTSDCLDHWIQEALAGLQPMLRIDEARIRLEYRTECSPSYVASAHLVVPGPDVRAEAVDHTVRSALNKLMVKLESKALERASKRLRRLSRQRMPNFLCANQGLR